MNQKDHIAQIVEPLVQWYKKNRRELPWRKTPVDPYAVWISEIMLQQTRIEAVIPYYYRFLSALPNVKALAEADDDFLMKLWEGLGYYSRVRNLKKAAIQICNEHGGKIPSQSHVLKKLPGIGSYTAGAIASIAYGEGSPAVDGNVLRVLSRILGDYEDIALEKTKKKAGELLREVYPIGEDAGCFTQGLMELGEVACIPNGTPLCQSCPVCKICYAHVNNVCRELPVKSGKKARKIEKRTLMLLEQNGMFALQRRPKQGLLASMLEFPSILSEESVEEHLTSLGLEIIDSRPCGNAVHVFSHIEWHMEGLWIRCRGNKESLQWYSAEEILTKLPLPTAFRYYRKLLKSQIGK